MLSSTQRLRVYAESREKRWVLLNCVRIIAHLFVDFSVGATLRDRALAGEMARDCSQSSKTSRTHVEDMRGSCRRLPRTCLPRTSPTRRRHHSSFCTGPRFQGQRWKIPANIVADLRTTSCDSKLRDRRKQSALKNDASCLHYIYQYGVLVLPIFGDILTWPGNRIAPLDL